MNPNLQYVFNPERDKFPAKFYLEDGNPEMYTRENILKREDLAENLLIDQAIETFIRDHFSLKSSSNNCTKDEYLKVFS